MVSKLPWLYWLKTAIPACIVTEAKEQKLLLSNEVLEKIEQGDRRLIVQFRKITISTF